VVYGDSGSEWCYSSDSSTVEEVDYPASDESVTAVGGTELLGPGDEVAWNFCQSDESIACANDYGGLAAGGGGMSRYIQRPSWQPNILYWPVAQVCGQYCREVPDVSANAGVGMVIYANGSWTAVAGTSAAAPLVAGLVADRSVLGWVLDPGSWGDPRLRGARRRATLRSPIRILDSVQRVIPMVTQPSDGRERRAACVQSAAWGDASASVLDCPRCSGWSCSSPP
jgi:hypothetical protein